MSDNATLDEFASRLVELSDHRGLCPVLTVERGLSLRPIFFGQLAGWITVLAERPMRFDLVIRPFGPFATACRWRALREAAKLSIEMPPEASVSVGVTVGRPAGRRRPLVVGIASEAVDLPEWTQRIRVCTQPTEPDAVQVVAA